MKPCSLNENFLTVIKVFVEEESRYILCSRKGEIEDITVAVFRGLGLNPLEKWGVKAGKSSLFKAWEIPSWEVIAGV